MTEAPSDAIGLSERLRDVEAAERRVAGDCDCRPEDTANWQYADTCREAAAALDALQGEIRQWANEVARYKAYAEKFDEENAALQAKVKELEKAIAHEWFIEQCGEIGYVGIRDYSAMESRATSAEQERDEALERACGVIRQWTNHAHMQLCAGEMTAQERRTTEAILNAVERQVRRLATGTEKEGNNA